MKKYLKTKITTRIVKTIKNVSKKLRKKRIKKKKYYIKINTRKCVYVLAKFLLKNPKKKSYINRNSFKKFKAVTFTLIKFLTWVRVLTNKFSLLTFKIHIMDFKAIQYLIFILNVVYSQRVLLRFNTIVGLKKRFFKNWDIKKLIFSVSYSRNLGLLRTSYQFTSKKKKNKFIFFKLKKLILEQKLFSALSKTVFVSLKRICNKISPKFSLVVPRTSRMWWVSYLFYFKDLINILYFSAYFSNSNLITGFIARNILNKKNHYRLLRSIKRIINYFFWFERAPGFCGIRIRVHGKFHGILRKRKFHMRLGRTGLHTLQTRVDYSYAQSFTRFGVFSIKTWLLYIK